MHTLCATRLAFASCRTKVTTEPDLIVADQDGAVVIPAALVGEVVALAVEQERLEGWIMTEIDRGVPLPGLYPADDETKARYAAFKKRG